MGIPARLIEFLNRAQVGYEIIHHPRAFSAQELSAVEGVTGHQHAKVIIVNIAGKLIMTVLASSKRVDWKRLESVLGGQPVLASEEDFRNTFSDCETGTMPPFGHLYGVATYIDREFTENSWIVFEAGTHSDAIKINYTDYARIAQPEVADFAVKWNG